MKFFIISCCSNAIYTNLVKKGISQSLEHLKPLQLEQPKKMR